MDRTWRADNGIRGILGVTNPIQLSSTSGVVYTFSFRRNLAGANPNVGAGVGTVSVKNGVPVCSQPTYSQPPTNQSKSPARGSTSETTTGVKLVMFTNKPRSYWWDAATEPFYGVNSAWLDAQGSYIYAMGPADATAAGGDWQYMTRVPVQQATTLSSYQYVLFR